MKPKAEEVLKWHGKALEDPLLTELAEKEFAVLGYPRHIDYDPETGEPLAIVCRVCGAKIAGWVDNEVTDQRIDRISPTNTVTKMMMRQKFSRLGNCHQLRMLLDDNTLYEPLVCKDCAKKVDNRMAQELFLSDLIEIIAETMARGKNPDRAINVVRHHSQRHVRTW